MRRQTRSRRRGAHLYFLCGFVTGLIAIVGAWFGDCFIKSDNSWTFINSLARVDGQNYKHIIEHGYSYTPHHPSSVAFFPAYPVSAYGVAQILRLETVTAQVAVSNVCCLAAFVLMGIYLTTREDSQPLSFKRATAVRPTCVTGERGLAIQSSLSRRARDERNFALLAMGVVPTTFFFRMAYTESMFLCVAIGGMYAISVGWPLPVVALIVGLATAVRPVGVAMILPLGWYVWQTSTSRQTFALRLCYAIPLGCWGLLVYMFYQYYTFGEPLAFAITQDYHRMRPEAAVSDKAFALLAWEPIRDVYDPSSLGYWRNLFDMPSALFSMEFANPIYMLGTAALVVLGAYKRWLTSYEILLAIPLLAIPYITRAYEMRMLSEGRFAAVVFPVYIVLGYLLTRMPMLIAVSLLALSGLMMGIYAALFAAGYPFL